MQYRHEQKYIINESDACTLRMGLSAVCEPDENAIDGKYSIRSLYFDTPEDSALLDNISGAAHRAKYRIRYYSGNTQIIHLEKKCKDLGLGYKLEAQISAEEVNKILAGDCEFLKEKNGEIFAEFYHDLVFRGLAPRAL